jgi:TetR/AcrR family transcriptional regulator, mexJK operon transcriptional repressor
MADVEFTHDADTRITTPRAKPQRTGRPVDPAKEAAILSAARQCFLGLPYDRVSMEAIADRAGVSKVTLYAKYKSKDGLFVAAMSESCAAIYGKARLTTESGGPIREALVELGVRFMVMILDSEVAAMHGVMMQLAQTRPALPRQFYETAVVRSVDTLAETLAIATENLVLKCPNPRQAAVQFVAMVQGEFRYQLELGVSSAVSHDEIAAYVSSCVDVFLRGYAV